MTFGLILHVSDPRSARFHGKASRLFPAIFQRRKQFSPDHVWAGTPCSHPISEFPPASFYDGFSNSSDARAAFSAFDLRPGPSRHATVFPQKFPVMLLRRLKRVSFPAMTFVGEECAAQFPLATQPDEETVRALFALVDSRDAGVTLCLSNCHSRLFYLPDLQKATSCSFQSQARRAPSEDRSIQLVGARCANGLKKPASVS